MFFSCKPPQILLTNRMNNKKLQLSALEFNGDYQILSLLTVCSTETLCVSLISPWNMCFSVITTGASVSLVKKGVPVDGGGLLGDSHPGFQFLLTHYLQS